MKWSGRCNHCAKLRGSRVDAITDTYSFIQQSDHKSLVEII